MDQAFTLGSNLDTQWWTKLNGWCLKYQSQIILVSLLTWGPGAIKDKYPIYLFFWTWWALVCLRNISNFSFLPNSHKVLWGNSQNTKLELPPQASIQNSAWWIRNDRVWCRSISSNNRGQCVIKIIYDAKNSCMWAIYHWPNFTLLSPALFTSQTACPKAHLLSAIIDNAQNCFALQFSASGSNHKEGMRK